MTSESGLPCLKTNTSKVARYWLKAFLLPPRQAAFLLLTVHAQIQPATALSYSWFKDAYKLKSRYSWRRYSTLLKKEEPGQETIEPQKIENLRQRNIDEKRHGEALLEKV